MSANEIVERLRDASSSGLYTVVKEDELVGAARAARIATARVSLAEVGTKEELLRRFASALGFPDWFGANWDALEDCLTDLSWLPAGGRLLLIGEIAGLEALAPEDRDILVDVLRSSARFWAEEAAPFFVVFVDPAGTLAFPALLADARR
jgi:hypothetical protein